MSSVKFYTNPMSRGQIVRWMLEEAGCDYEQILLVYGDTMHGPDYLAVNPMAKVPAIVHDGHIVTECAAICAYLADAFPANKLAPTLNERADYYRWMFFAAGPVEAAVTDKALNVDVPAERQPMVGYGNYDKMVDVLDQAASEWSSYICGDEFTAADVYVGSQIIWGLQFGSLPHRDSFAAYAERLTKRDAYKKAKNIDNALIEAAQDQAKA